MLDRVQPSANDANIVVDLHTPGINVTMAAGKVVRVIVQKLSFELDCTQGVKLVEDPAMRFQLQVEIKERTKQEFAVEVTVGTNEVCDIARGEGTGFDEMKIGFSFSISCLLEID